MLAMAWIPRSRCLTARSCAPMLRAPALLLGRRRRHVPGYRVALGLVVREGLDRLLLDQHLAAADLEPPAEFVDRVLERGRGVVRQLASLPDRVVDARALSLHRVDELLLEPADVVHGHVIEVPGRARPYHHHLPFHRQRAVLGLLAQFAPPRTPVHLRARD